MSTTPEFTKEELKELIGNPPEGSHPGEWHPRDITWHAERANWAKQVHRLQMENARLVAHIGRIEKAVQDAAVDAVRF